MNTGTFLSEDEMNLLEKNVEILYHLQTKLRHYFELKRDVRKQLKLNPLTEIGDYKINDSGFDLKISKI